MSKWLKDKEEINSLIGCQQEDGQLITKDIVAEARDKKSPIHKYFEWDKSKASYQFNLMQARVLIRRIPVEYVNNDGDKSTISKFINIKTIDEKKGEISRGYYPIEVVKADDDFKRQVTSWSLSQQSPGLQSQVFS